MEGTQGHSEAMASLRLAPGDTEEATITFEPAGALQFACHVEGHYDGGMIGAISVG